MFNKHLLTTVLKLVCSSAVIISRILYLIAPSLSSSHPPSRSVRLTSRTMKIARSYYEDSGKGIKLKPINLSSTLEKLYAWEKKLHKEIKVRWWKFFFFWIICFMVSTVGNIRGEWSYASYAKNCSCTKNVCSLSSFYIFFMRLEHDISYPNNWWQL